MCEVIAFLIKFPGGEGGSLLLLTPLGQAIMAELRLKGLMESGRTAQQPAEYASSVDATPSTSNSSSGSTKRKG